MSERRIAVMAGNPLVERTKSGEIVIDPQLKAFESALRLVAQCREQIVKIAAVFDHKGNFRGQFLDDSQPFPSRRAKRRVEKHLRLSHLHPDIRKIYDVVAKDYRVHLEDVAVFSEDLLRTIIIDQVPKNTPWMYSPRPTKGMKQDCSAGACQVNWGEAQQGEEEEEGRRVNCRAMTAAAIQRLSKDATEVQAFWSFDPTRVDPSVVTCGTVLAYTVLGVNVPVTQHMLFHPYAKDPNDPIIQKLRPCVMTTQFKV